MIKIYRREVKLILVLLTLSLSSAFTSVFTSTKSGVSYKWLQKSIGETPVLGDTLFVQISLTDSEGLAKKSVKEDQYDIFLLGLDSRYALLDELFLEMGVDDILLIRNDKLLSHLVSINEVEAAGGYLLISLIRIGRSLKEQSYDLEGLARVTTASGLQFILIKQGHGLKAALGYTVTFHFTGYLEDGTQFSSTQNGGEPLRIVLGIDQIIAGWEEGLQMMREGEIMRFIIPPELAFGETGIPDIVPPHALIYFDIEMIKVE